MFIPLLTKIKNAQILHKESIRFPYSKMDDAVLQVLADEKYIASYEKKGRNPKKYFEVQLLYRNGKEAISGIRFVSTPGRRMYAGKAELRPIRQGYGTAVISTSQGILTDKEARKKKIGGQVLFNIW